MIPWSPTWPIGAAHQGNVDHRRSKAGNGRASHGLRSCVCGEGIATASPRSRDEIAPPLGPPIPKLRKGIVAVKIRDSARIVRQTRSRFGSKGDLAACFVDVRSSPNNRHTGSKAWECRLRARSELFDRSVLVAVPERIDQVARMLARVGGGSGNRDDSPDEVGTSRREHERDDRT